MSVLLIGLPQPTARHRRVSSLADVPHRCLLTRTAPWAGQCPVDTPWSQVLCWPTGSQGRGARGEESPDL